MLLSTIKTDMINARKTGNKDKLVKLSTLVGEIQAKEMTKKSELTDQEVLQIIRKFINNLDETIKIFKEANKDIAYLNSERDIYNQYLPKEMTSEEIEEYFKALKNENIIALNVLMGSLKKYAEENGVIYNGKNASEIAKKLI